MFAYVFVKWAWMALALAFDMVMELEMEVGVAIEVEAHALVIHFTQPTGRDSRWWFVVLFHLKSPLKQEWPDFGLPGICTYAISIKCYRKVRAKSPAEHNDLLAVLPGNHFSCGHQDSDISGMFWKLSIKESMRLKACEIASIRKYITLKMEPINVFIIVVFLSIVFFS